jgi:tmRNA-binding protein
VALAKGKQLHDKRAAAKERIADREAAEAVRERVKGG